jgi:hypothetical protein
MRRSVAARASSLLVVMRSCVQPLGLAADPLGATLSTLARVAYNTQIKKDAACRLRLDIAQMCLSLNPYIWKNSSICFLNVS